MTKTIKYRSREEADFSFSINKRGAVGLQDENGATHIWNSAYGPHRLVRVGGWLAECSNGRIFIKNTAALGPGNKLDINFQEGEAVVSLDYRDEEGRPKTERFKKTVLITADGKQLFIQQNEAVQSPSQVSESGNADLKKKVTELEKKNKALEKERAELCREVQSVKAENRELQTLVEGRMEEQAARLGQLQKQLSTEGAEKLKEIREAEEAYRRKQEEIQEAERKKEQLQKERNRSEQELAQLQAELEELRSAKELESLDCEKARREIKELKSQAAYDEETLALISEESFMKCSSVKTAIEEVKKKLDETEKRVGMIIRVRERINSTIQDAIVLAGDGTIPISAETGG